MTRRRLPGLARLAAGFTLIELLVAISILAIVAVLGWRGLDGIIRSRVALTAQMEQTRGMQLAFAQMQSDCEHLADQDALHKRDVLLAQDGRLTLVRTVLAENEPSRLQVVSYRIQDGVLTRRESRAVRDLTQLDALWQNALSESDTTPAVALQAGLSGMRMRIWQGAGWRSTSTGGQQLQQAAPQARGGPSGLEVSLLMPGQEQESVMVKIFLLGAV